MQTLEYRSDEKNPKPQTQQPDSPVRINVNQNFAIKSIKCL